MFNVRHGDMVRLATVLSTGTTHLVQQRDLDRDLVYCWSHLEGYETSPTRLAPKLPSTSTTFRRGDVRLYEERATPELLARLFDQTRQTVKANLLMAGEIVVKKQANKVRFAKAPTAQRHPQNLKCPCCGFAMFLRKRANASFFGCGAFSFTGCRSRWTARDGWNLSGTKLEGSPLQGTAKGTDLSGG